MAKICFVSYEIFPTTRGGMGVFLYNTAYYLLSLGHDLVFLLDIPIYEFKRFNEEDRLQLPNSNQCTAYQLDILCSDIPYHKEDFYSLYAWQSYRFHFACQKIVEGESPELIEFFDYSGVAYYALVSKIIGTAYKNSHIAIRLHTSNELMDIQNPSPFDRDKFYNYALERGALRIAETVIYPTHTFFEEAYRPHYNEAWFGNLAFSRPPLVKHPQFTDIRSDANIILFYGRLFSVKGPDCFVDAAVLYLQDPTIPPMQFYLIGFDSNRPPIGTFPTYREYLLGRIPIELQDKFTFIESVNWNQLGELLSRVRFAVFSPLFESYSYAAHELYAAKVPLIVSNIPAFHEDFKHEKNCLVFGNNATDLYIQMKRLAIDDTLLKEITYPYKIDSNPLSGFYDTHERPSWIHPGLNDVDKIPQIKIVILQDEHDEEVLHATLLALEHYSTNLDLVIGIKDKGNSKARFLGSLYSFYDKHGNLIRPTDLVTKNIILILRTGDKPDALFLRTALNILAHQPEITFVGCWKYVSTDGIEQLETYPLDLVLEAALFENQPTLSRCLMRTDSNKPILELFDPAAGELGEMDYLWNLNKNNVCGLVIPNPLIQINEKDAKPFSVQQFSYFLLREDPKGIRLLARYLFTCYNPDAKPKNITKDEAILAASTGWRMQPTFRKIRQSIRRYLERSQTGVRVLKLIIKIWGWVKKQG